MTFLPVVTREMSVLSRRRSTYWSRTATAILALLLMVWLFLVSMSGLSFAQIGRSIFLVLGGLCFLYALFVGVLSTSDSLSEEKREGTLGLLFLTDLKGYDIVLGKLAATSLNAVYALLGLLPMLSLALLLGGVTLAQVGQLALVLGNTMFLSLALGMFVSAFSVNERKAMFASTVTLFLLTIVPFFLSIAFAKYRVIPPEVLWASPLYSFLCTQSLFFPIPLFNASMFFHSIAFQHWLAWCFLFFGCVHVPRSLNESATRRLIGLREKSSQGAGVKLRKDERHRSSLLDRNAFLWLAAREKQKPLWAWLILAIFLGLYVWVGFASTDYGWRMDWDTGCILLFLTHFVFKLWLASEVCSRLIQDRRSGALELLLSTPLSVRQIAHGQHLALRRIFTGPMLALIAFELWLLFRALKFAPGQALPDEAVAYIVGITTLLLDLWALKWVGMWLSLFGKSIERILIATLARIMAVPWLAFFVLAASMAGLAVMTGQHPPDKSKLFWIWGGCSVFFALLFALPARRNFLSAFREIAANRYESPAELANDKLLKKRALEKPGQPRLPLWIHRHPAWSTTIVILLVLLGTMWIRRTYWEHQLRKQIAALTAQGQPIKTSELARIHPAVARRDDAFHSLAAGNFVTFGVNWSQVHQLFGVFNSPSARYISSPQDKTIPILTSFVRASSNQISLLRGITNFPSGYIPPVMDPQGYRPIEGLQNFINLGFADLMLAYSERDSERIERDLRALFHLARILRTQPVHHAQAVCAGLLNRLGTAVETFVARDLLSPEFLAELELTAELLQSDQILRKNLAIVRVVLIEMRAGTVSAIPGQVKPLDSFRHGFAEASGSQQQQLTQSLTLFEAALARADQPKSLSDWAIALRPWDANQNQVTPSIDRLTESFIRQIIIQDLWLNAKAKVLGAAAAIAAQRLQAKSETARSMPDQEIVKQLEKTIDPFSEKPLRWQPGSKLSVLYSIGPDGRDDSGAPMSNYLGDIGFFFHEPDEAQP